MKPHINTQTIPSKNLNHELRPFWNRYFSFDWKLGLFLILLVCIPRFALVLNANATGNYGAIGLIMMISAIIPFIFLSKYGRREIGITKPKKYSWLIIAFVAGLVVNLLKVFTWGRKALPGTWITLERKPDL